MGNHKYYMDKVRKRRAPLEKKVQEDPEYLAHLDAEIGELTAQLADLDATGH